MFSTDNVEVSSIGDKPIEAGDKVKEIMDKEKGYNITCVVLCGKKDILHIVEETNGGCNLYILRNTTKSEQ